jgi:hypothetical protein
MRLSRRLPVISSTLRAPAGFAGVNLFMAETLFCAGFYHASPPLTNATRLCQRQSREFLAHEVGYGMHTCSVTGVTDQAEA